MSHATELVEDNPSDRELRRNSHPPDWENPVARGRYNLVVIGGGTAGLVGAGMAALLGARVALIERDLMGGDCLVTGCVPSKSLIRAARIAADVTDAPRFGIALPADVEVDFPKVMERMRTIRARISHHDAAAHFRDTYGVDVFLGDASFVGPDSVQVAGQTLRYRNAVIATGARAVALSISGLPGGALHTNETIFNLIERPRRLAVIGGGPIGCELAQAFARLGSEVTIVHRGDRLLPHDEPEAGQTLREVLEREGVRVLLGTTVERGEVGQDGKLLHLRSKSSASTLSTDAVLVGIGRVPNVEGLGLEAAGVEYDRDGVNVDDFLRTTNPRIYAAGDVCLREKFTHTADASARLAVQNALLFRRLRWSRQVVPWVTYTDPEVAHVGLSEEEARCQGLKVDAYRVNLSEVDRAITDGADAGFVKLVARMGQVVGATIVAPHAGEMVGEMTAAITAGIKLGQLSRMIHPYPTYAEAFRKAADLHEQKRLTRWTRSLLGKWFAFRR